MQSVGSVSSVTQLGKILLTWDTRILSPKPFVSDYSTGACAHCFLFRPDSELFVENLRHVEQT